MSENQDWKGNNGWTQYQKLVLAQLEQHSDMLKEINKKIDDVYDKYRDDMNQVYLKMAY